MKTNGARTTVWHFCCVTAAAIFALIGIAKGRDIAKLRVLSDGYPRMFFFRQVEGMAANCNSVLRKGYSSSG